MKYTIVFLIPSLAAGGAERVFANIVNGIDKKKFDVTIAYLSEKNKVYPISNQVNTINLNAKRLRNAPLKILNLIRYKKPDLVVSTLGHMNILLMILRPFISKKTKIIIRQTNILSYNFSKNVVKRIVQKRLIHLLKYADNIVCQSEFMKKDLLKYIDTNDSRIVKIFNPVNIEEIRENSKEKVNYTFEKKYKHIIFIGRLNEVKRVPLILDAFEDYYKKNQKTKLIILGTGPQEEKLKFLIRRKGLTENVELLGFQKNPYKWMKHSDLLLLASKSEGMPNVLIEALALKIPILIKSHPGGTIDIINAMDIKDRFVNEFVIDNDSFIPYTNNIEEKLQKNFGANKIIEQYERVFISVINRK